MVGGAYALVLSAFVCRDYQSDSLIEPFRKAKSSRTKYSKRKRREASIIAAPFLASINAEAKVAKATVPASY